MFDSLDRIRLLKGILQVFVPTNTKLGTRRKVTFWIHRKLLDFQVRAVTDFTCS